MLKELQKICSSSNILASEKSTSDWSENLLLKLESQIMEHPDNRTVQNCAFRSFPIDHRKYKVPVLCFLFPFSTSLTGRA